WKHYQDDEMAESQNEGVVGQKNDKAWEWFTALKNTDPWFDEEEEQKQQYEELESWFSEDQIAWALSANSGDATSAYVPGSYEDAAADEDCEGIRIYEEALLRAKTLRLGEYDDEEGNEEAEPPRKSQSRASEKPKDSLTTPSPRP
ncbi:unnamed protein product, partial [Durusdinium trenchii]